jgi:hypothetical protein
VPTDILLRGQAVFPYPPLPLPVLAEGQGERREAEIYLDSHYIM